MHQRHSDLTLLAPGRQTAITMSRLTYLARYSTTCRLSPRCSIQVMHPQLTYPAEHHVKTILECHSPVTRDRLQYASRHRHHLQSGDNAR